MAKRLVAAEKSGDPYTLLITYYQIPTLDGLKLTQYLRRHPRFVDLAIIVMSSVNDAVVKDAFKEVGVSDYVVKLIALGDFNHLILDVSQRVGLRSHPSTRNLDTSKNGFFGRV